MIVCVQRVICNFVSLLFGSGQLTSAALLSKHFYNTSPDDAMSHFVYILDMKTWILLITGDKGCCHFKVKIKKYNLIITSALKTNLSI